MKDFLNKHLHEIVIIVPIVIAVFLLVTVIVYSKAMERKEFDTTNVEVVEVRLPSVELEKYKKLDKIGE